METYHGSGCLSRWRRAGTLHLPGASSKHLRNAPAQGRGEGTHGTNRTAQPRPRGCPMSNWTLAHWFSCITSVVPAEHDAALARLVRMLTGDADRPRPPISLPGRPADPPPARSLVNTETNSTAPRSGLAASYATSTLVNAPYEPGDEQVGAWPRDALERMNRRFAERLERAIASGQEHQPAPPR